MCREPIFEYAWLRLRVSHVSCADLPEVRKLCGVFGCPDCQPTIAGEHGAATVPRTTDAVLEVINEANDTLVFGLLSDARAILAAAKLSNTHLDAACPMLRMPHFSFVCFPGDRLHLL